MTLTRCRQLFKWLLAVVAFHSGFLHVLERLRPRGVRILVYHRVQLRRLDDGMTVSQGVFEAQLHHLERWYQVVSLDTVPGLLAQERLPSHRLVAITHDDGYRDNFEVAWPLLKRYDLPATIFLTVGPVDRCVPLWTELLREAVWTSPQKSVDLQEVGLGAWPLRSEADRLACFKGLSAGLKLLQEDVRRRTFESVLGALEWRGWQSSADDLMLTWGMVREMRKGGISFGAHTLSHSILTRLTDEEAEREIVDSKRRIEEQLGEPVRHFAYPNGAQLDWNTRVREIVRAAGLETAVTAVRGSNPVRQDLYSLRRIEVNDAGCIDPFGRFSTAMFEGQLVGLFGGWGRQWR